MASPDWFVIFNPTAGRRPRPATIDSTLRAALGNKVRVHNLARSVSLDLSETLARVGSNVAVWGGDGTVASVVNAMDLSRQRLLIVPGGTGNGLARDVGHAGVSTALSAASHGHERDVDLLQVAFRQGTEWHERLAISTVGLGYVSGCAALADAGFRRLGPLCYPTAALTHAPVQRPFSTTLELEGSTEQLTLTNVVVNTTRHAGNFAVFPSAQPDDGRLHVLTSKSGILGSILHAVAVLSAQYFYVSGPIRSGKEISLRLDAPQTLMLDGELWTGVREVRVLVRPRALRCVVARPE